MYFKGSGSVGKATNWQPWQVLHFASTCLSIPATRPCCGVSVLSLSTPDVVRVPDLPHCHIILLELGILFLLGQACLEWKVHFLWLYTVVGHCPILLLWGRACGQSARLIPEGSLPLFAVQAVVSYLAPQGQLSWSLVPLRK